MDNYLQSCGLNKVPEAIIKRLNSDITMEEIYEAINALKIGKASGPDGLTAMFFKVCKDQVIPYLGQIMNGGLQGDDIPDSWKAAAITLIHKERSDRTDVRNYRLISLLNIDYKIYANILANRLKEYLTEYINEDQVGFLPCRHLKDNLS